VRAHILRSMTQLQRDPTTWLYPVPTPYKTGRLAVTKRHEIYFEESGNPKGKPVVFLHGGPGGGTVPAHRRFFDPRRYRIVLFDQRGCGQSTPYASVEDNGTWELVSDMERIRTELAIERWQVFGGSWGSTLALAYAEKHPERVSELVLRGIFLLRKKEIDWFYQEGANAIYPDAWAPYEAAIPTSERKDYLKAYYKRLMSEDPAVHMPAARAWSVWEGSTSKLLPDDAFAASFGADATTLAFARIEAHYFHHKGFFDADDQLLRDVDKIRKIPGTIVQGRYDVVCPLMSAYDLHKAWPESELMIVPDAGHSAFEPGISRALVATTDRYAR